MYRVQSRSLRGSGISVLKEPNTFLSQFHRASCDWTRHLKSLNFSAVNYRMWVLQLLHCPFHRADLGIIGDDNRYSP